ncbi:hypothetical protein PISL3812_09934 [Talaromyces islandicus]|uniref:Ubiquitin-like protease family profile domain-containing protein n=1 Tax=Talaromyces islandicus TaxID=28573 RepID=A0A0U1MCL7_TALIS|nr:hypothetical protein PISL3812_09934 [Talaromyces islandicus]
MVKGAEDFRYQIWPVNETHLWIERFGNQIAPMPHWRAVKANFVATVALSRNLYPINGLKSENLVTSALHGGASQPEKLKYQIQRSKQTRSNSTDNTISLVGEDSVENDVDEEEHGTEDGPIPGIRASSCEMAQSQPHVEGLMEGEEFAITGMIPESTILDTILQVVQVLHQLSIYRIEVPRPIHVRILQTIQKSDSEQLTTSLDTRWSDGSTWVRILEMGSCASIRATVLNMVEYMGAWAWFDEQCQHAKATVYTKKGRLVDRRGGASYVLDMLQQHQTGATTPEKWISGVGPVTVRAIRDTANCDGKTTQLRKRIINQLHRGQKLSKLVKAVGLGILLGPKIWDYTKMSWKQFDALIEMIQSDHRKMNLYKVLSPQVEQLVHQGLPDLHAFYNDLESEKLIPASQVNQLRMEYVLDSDALPDAQLDAAVDQLIQLIGSKVLNNLPDKNSSVSVNGSAEISCTIFEQLRPGTWMSDEIIMAAMETIDKPAFVRHGLSIPLDKIDRHGQMWAIERPFTGWAKKMASYRRDTEEAGSLVYFCPINHQNNHYSLLEINERERKIRHFDSLAGKDRHDRVSSLIKKEFAGLRYSYEEATTPQQTDNWSCGTRVIWNLKRLANGLPIGIWDTVHDSNRMALEIVDGLTACVEDGRVIKYRD